MAIENGNSVKRETKQTDKRGETKGHSKEGKKVQDLGTMTRDYEKINQLKITPK